MSSNLSPNAANKALFPDGLKTSGQHNPIYDQLTPPAQFPKEITGPTVWRAEDYRDHPERWTHAFSSDEVAELSQASGAFLKSGKPLTAMAKVCSLVLGVNGELRLLIRWSTGSVPSAEARGILRDCETGDPQRQGFHLV